MEMFAFFIVALAVASADVILEGPCPNLTPVMNFDMAAFQGPWYEVKRMLITNEVHAECSISDYTLVHDVLRVNSTHVYNGVRKSLWGVISRADNSGSTGSLILSTVVADNVRISRYWVLSTDYKNYGIIASCRDIKNSNLHAIYLWIVSRNKTLSPASTEIVNHFLKDHAKDFPENRLVENDISDQACSFKRESAYIVPFHQ